MPRISHSRNLRNGRFCAPGYIYMVTTTTLHREPILAQWPLGRLLVREFKQAQALELVNSLAWVVMPDHLHWLLELRAGSLADLMQRVKSKSAKAINQACGRQGRLWQDGFHDVAVRREEDIVRFARYIVANPLRAKLVTSLRDYPLWDAVWIEGQQSPAEQPPTTIASFTNNADNTATVGDTSSAGD